MYSYLAGLEIQIRVVHALFIRDLMMRYGRDNIGFLWLILEPMILCGGVISLRWALQSHEENGVPLVALLLSGYMPLTLWRYLTNRSVFILRRNMGILYHRHVTLIDAFLTTVVLEFIGCTLAFSVNYFILRVIGVLDPIQNLGFVIEGWCAMGFLSLGVASAIAVLTEQYEVAERFIQPMQYLILPICGFLYMADWLPERARNLALYIPLLHCFEIIRHGFFGEAIPTHYTLAYPLLFSTVLLAIFLPRFEKVRDVIPVG